MEQEKKRTKLYRRRRNSNTVVVLVGTIALLYLILQTVHALSNHVTTVAATRVTVENSIECSGIFIRDEVLVESLTSSTVKQLVSTGERVKKQSELAVSYAGESALETSRELELLEDEVALLRAALRSAGDFSDTARLDQQLTSAMRTLNAQVKDGIVTDARDTADSLREQSLRRAVWKQNPLKKSLTRWRIAWNPSAAGSAGRPVPSGLRQRGIFQNPLTVMKGF